MEPQALIQIITIVAPIFIAIAGYGIAKKRNRKGWLWFINCLLTGFLGLIVIACSKPLDYDEKLEFEVSIPKKLHDEWERTIKIKINKY